MWHRCLRCPRKSGFPPATRRIVMSDAAWGLRYFSPTLGGIGSALYAEDGRKICSSMAIYGEGKEAGNESGYVVGMTTCYPKPGSVKISDGEALVFESNYSSNQMHTGVMGLFYLYIADQLPKDSSLSREVNEHIIFPKYGWALDFVGVAVALAVGFSYSRKNEREEGYQSLVV